MDLMTKQIIESVPRFSNKKGKIRKVNITLDTNGQKKNFDEEYSFIFNGNYLEELTSISPCNLDNQLYFSSQPQNPVQSLTQNAKFITQNIIIEEFTNKNQNAKFWLSIFKSECNRFNVDKDLFIEI